MFELLALLVLGIGHGFETRCKYESNRDFDYQSERDSLLNGHLYWTDHKGRSWINGSLRPQEVRVIPRRTGSNQTELIAYDANDIFKEVMNITREQYYNESIRNRIKAIEMGCGTYELKDKDKSEDYVPFRVEISTGERIRLELQGRKITDKYNQILGYEYRCFKRYYKYKNSKDFFDRKKGEFIHIPEGKTERITLKEFTELGGFIQEMYPWKKYIFSPGYDVKCELCLNNILSEDKLHIDEEKLKAYTRLKEGKGEQYYVWE